MSRRAFATGQGDIVRFTGLAIVAAALVGLSSTAEGQQVMGRCATCHFANIPDVPGASHLGEWAASPHAAAGVGCESCHGGNPTTVVPSEAHRGVESPRLAWSRVAPAHLPATCGACHAAERDAFRRSPHDAPLASGVANAPTCSTCHGAMTSRVPSAAALELRCARCHGPQSVGAGYPGRARAFVTALMSIDTDLSQARWRLSRGGGGARARALEAEAGARLAEVAEAWHTFDMAEAERRANAARAAVDNLLAQLENP